MTTTAVTKPTDHTSERPPEVAGRGVRRANPKRIIGYGVLIIFAVIYLYPFLIQIATSLKSDPDSIARPLSLIPNPFDLDAWKRMFGLTSDSSVPIMTWMGNSVLVTVVVTASRVFLDSLAGYALSRLHFRGRGFLFAALLAVMSVPGVALLVPKFLIVTYLGIFDTYTAMIVPLMVDAAGIFIMKQFFDSVPISIEEAARMDGASVFRTFWSVVLPMARPALITLTILSFQGSSERVQPLPGRHPELEPQDDDHRACQSDQWRARDGVAVPAQDGCGTADHHPGRCAVLRLPTPFRPRRERRRREGLSSAPGGYLDRRARTAPNTRNAPRSATIGPTMAHSVTPVIPWPCVPT